MKISYFISHFIRPIRPILTAAVFVLSTAAVSAQSTYTWANSNVDATPTSLFDWFTGGENPQGTWIGGDPVSNNANTIQFFEDTTTALTNTAVPSSQTVNLNNGGSAFELGTLTLSGLASETTSADLTMTLSGDALNFSGATGTLNLDALNATRTISYNLNNAIQLGTASSGSALTLGGNGTGNFVLGGIISELQAGGGSLIKNGSSTVTLAGDNSYTGATTLNAGRLNLNSASAIGTGSLFIGNGTTLGNTSGAAITLSTNNAQTWLGNFTYAGTSDLNLGTGAVSLGSSTRTVTVSANTLSVGGVISGSNGAGLTMAGDGVLSLDAANTYSGDTTISGGVLLLNNANALPGGVGATGGTSNLKLNGTWFKGGGVVGLTSDFSRSIGTSASQVQWTDAGGFAAFGADRTVNLGGNETPSTIVWGNTTANGGLNGKGLSLGATAATHTVDLVNGLDLGSTNRTVVVGNGAAAIDAKISGSISGTSALSKGGSGTLLLTGSNTYSGGTYVQGVLAINNASALGTNFVQINNNGALASTSPTPLTIANTVKVSGAFGTNHTLGNAAATGNLVLSGGITITNGGSNLTNSAYFNLTGLSSVDITGPVSATGAYTVAFNVGAGQELRFGADNSGWTQGKNLTNSGTYIIGHPKALGSGDIWLGDNGTGRENALIVSEVDLTGDNALTNTFVIPRISGGYSLWVGGGFGGTNSIELAGGVQFNSRARGLTNYISGGSLLISGTVSGSQEGANPYLIGTGNTIISGDIVNGTSTNLPIVIQNTGITTFSGTNTYTGETNVQAGTLVLRGTQAKASGLVRGRAAATIGLGVGGANSYTSADVAALFGNTLSGFSMDTGAGVAVDTTDGDFTVSDDLAGARAFTKLGANTLTLTGTNTYTGTTTVLEGTLQINGSHQTGDTSVLNGGALGGIATITGNVVIADGGTIAPGNSPGILTIDGNLNFTDDTELAGVPTYNWEVSTADLYDQVFVKNGTLTIDDALEINLTTFEPTLDIIGQTFVLFDFTENASFVGDVSSWTVNVDDPYMSGTATISQSGNQIILSGIDIIIPEPSTAILISFGLLGLVLRRRR